MSEDFFNKYVPLTLFVTFACERELETEHNCNILTPTLMAVSIVSFLFSRAAQPEAQGSFCWLSLMHFISNFSGLQLISLAWLSLPHLVSITPNEHLRPGVF